ncbi:metalloprotease ATP23 [Rickenella mellea]|uniref:Mitochondrial inner membrane protease ATP23 n=1 Tax=Rickenella mellea TaxID=50990 RepID=A0A4Y7QGM4_9AGAM|nr:metalloprotease ATP23 [Rickenella mellea]
MVDNSSQSPSASVSPPNPPHETTTTDFFHAWRRKFGAVTGLGLSAEERADSLADHHRRTCVKWKTELANYSPAVSFMLKHIQQTGADVSPAKNIICLPCDDLRAGAYSPEIGAVVLCQGHLWNKKHMEHTLTHELVHMYDDCKFKVDWNNLRHHACSEIRANSLGGDCKMLRELRRFQFGFAKQHQACVRRRAVLSVASNPMCPAHQSAERAVNEVWESCFNDTRPFDEIY